MKNWKRLLAALCLALALTASGASAAEAEVFDAVQTDSAVYVNDRRAAITGYYIDGSNFFRVRDLAAALSGTSSQFEVSWNGELRQVELTTGVPYTGEVWEGRLPETAPAAPSAAALLLDGESQELTAYNIAGSTYYRLRDLGELLDFEVRWLEEDGSIALYTGLGQNIFLTEGSGDLRVMNREKSTQRWAGTCRSYLFGDDGEISVLDVSTGEDKADLLTLSTYDGAYELLESREVPLELDFFGGFYAGEEYRYIVFGCNNMEADDGKEVIRVVQYDRDFQRLNAASITGGRCATLRPFDAGTLRMSEADGELVVHTSRATYAAGEKMDHEAQLTLILDTQTMEVTNDLGLYQGCNVSRSYNQFVRSGGGGHLLVDHGDASPRGVVLHRYEAGAYTASMLFPIPGEAGASCTGVTVGGFEVSDSSYLVAINTVDHSMVEAYTDYTLEGVVPDERDVVLLSRGQEDGAAVEQICLTGYTGAGLLGSTPYLVKLAEDRFLVLWEEFCYYETETGAFAARSNGVRYVETDGMGQPLSEAQEMPDARLSYDCQPIYVDGAVVWYVNARAGRLFYQLVL